MLLITQKSDKYFTKLSWQGLIAFGLVIVKEKIQWLLDLATLALWDVYMECTIIHYQY